MNTNLVIGIIIGFVLGVLIGYQYGQKVERDRSEIRVNVGGTNLLEIK